MRSLARSTMNRNWTRCPKIAPGAMPPSHGWLANRDRAWGSTGDLARPETGGLFCGCGRGVTLAGWIEPGFIVAARRMGNRPDATAQRNDHRPPVVRNQAVGIQRPRAACYALPPVG